MQGQVGNLPLQISLLPDKHLACRREVARRERIEIYAAGDALAEFVSAIPIRGLAFALVDTSGLMA